MLDITGTLVWYWAICRREVWLMAHAIEPDEDDPYLELGRFLGEASYSRLKRRELNLPGMRIDLLEVRSGHLIVAEVKKSSRFLEAARLQLLFYLWRLKEDYGISASGELRIPNERKRIRVELEGQGQAKLEEIFSDIEKIIAQPFPPQPARIAFCKRCAYREFCWSSEEDI